MAYTVSDDLTTPVDLKDPYLAGLLAWLIPGAGHLYQGRTGKGILYMVCVLGAFFQGLYLSGGKCVFMQVQPEIRLPYLCQIGAGLPALPALVQWVRVVKYQKEPLSPAVMVPPRIDDNPHDPRSELSDWELEYGSDFEMGTVYTMIAGLLNVLAIFDAFRGPMRGNVETN